MIPSGEANQSITRGTNLDEVGKIFFAINSLADDTKFTAK